jgi:hypothetical protein
MWKDPHDEISAMSRSREVPKQDLHARLNTKSELMPNIRVRGKSQTNEFMNSTY